MHTNIVPHMFSSKAHAALVVLGTDHYVYLQMKKIKLMFRMRKKWLFISFVFFSAFLLIPSMLFR